MPPRVVLATILVALAPGCSLFLGDGVDADVDGGNDGGDGECTTPLDLATPATITQLEVGYDHSCVVFDNGGLRCWGQGTQGRTGLGNGDNTGVDPGSVPALLGDVIVGAPVQMVAAGALHTCAMLDGGAVRCFGANGVDQLGYAGPATDQIVPACAPAVPLPAPATQIAAGFRHTCAVLEPGTDVLCWGDNEVGQLGNGDSGGAVPADQGSVISFRADVIKLALGEAFSCALLADGDLFCWGGAGPWLANQNGGDVLTLDFDAPILANVTALDAGGFHACIVQGGQLLCWGLNDNGQLGIGDTQDVDFPQLVDNTLADSVALGRNHSCASYGAGIRCWGANNGGRLGLNNGNQNIGDDPAETPPSSYELSLDSSARQLDAGRAHTCAVLSDRVLVCWGENAEGQLGLGHTDAIGDDEVPSLGNASVDLGL